MKTIIVQISDTRWTMKAMHLACAIARKYRGEIILLRCVLANNPGLLGWGIPSMTDSEYANIKGLVTVAEDYGIGCRVQPMHYVSLSNALAQTAQTLNADILFAHFPSTRIAAWRKFRHWRLKRQLTNCQLYTLDDMKHLQIENLIVNRELVEDELGAELVNYDVKQEKISE